jgi:hypothetical protein
MIASTTETAFDRDGQARWYAKRHFETDSGVVEIHYLPTGAQPREIRFLEVNRLITGTTPLEPIDFGVDIRQPEGHTLNVLDVTLNQWEAIQKGRLPLPEGWTLDNAQTLARR